VATGSHQEQQEFKRRKIIKNYKFANSRNFQSFVWKEKCITVVGRTVNKSGRFFFFSTLSRNCKSAVHSFL